MFFLWYIASLLLIILKPCANEQLCIDSCSFNHDFDSTLTLPSNCTFIQREQCDAILTFDYSTRIVHIQFGALSLKKQQFNDNIYTSEMILHTVITLGDDSSTKNILEYYCSTGDQCEYNYILNQALSIYIHKTCHHFRVHLISLLHSDPTSTFRSCISHDNELIKCNQPCDLFFINPNETFRSCDGQRNLEFETTIGRTTPINKPEYDYRLYAYVCTTELCNGLEKQKQIEKLIQSDDGECFILFENQNQTATTTTIMIDYNQSISYSKSFFLYIICLLILFY